MLNGLMVALKLLNLHQKIATRIERFILKTRIGVAALDGLVTVLYLITGQYLAVATSGSAGQSDAHAFNNIVQVLPKPDPIFESGIVLSPVLT